MENIELTYKEIAEILIDCDRDVDVLLGIISTNNNNISNSDLQVFKDFICKTYLPKFNMKWQNSYRKKNTFLIKNEEWLTNIYTLSRSSLEYKDACSSRGRPEKNFEESSLRSKRRMVKQLCDSIPSDLLTSAAKKISKVDEFHTMFTPEKALSLIIDASLSKHQYEILRNSAKDIGCDIFPPYHQVLLAKKACYPDNIKIEESVSKVCLQDLLDHTVSRLLLSKSQNEINEMATELKMISKWGCDGSSGHSEYHQRFTDENLTDKNMFLTSLVPLTVTNDTNANEIYWTNLSPSSTRFCRPLKFEFVKETANVITEEVNRVEDEIRNLYPSVVEISNKVFKVNHNLMLTMIDVKVVNTITQTSAMCVCFICKAKPTEMNNIGELQKKSEEVGSLKFGISPLHARIKFMECILHIAYNKSFKAWRTTNDTRPQREEIKRQIQKNLKLVLGINVDVVKQGMGTTNDGNTSRKFFENPSKTADIVGVDENLIHRFKIILTTINCHEAIDPEKFHKYCIDTAKLYIELYSWYYMPITVHKVLFHGSKILSAAILPLGMLSEEAQEARNKDYRQYRLHHTRKCDRVSTNEDLMHLLLASSDPFINSFRNNPKKKHLEVHDDVKNLLL